MSENWGHDKEPLLWRLLEGMLINILLLLAGLVAVGEIIIDAVKHWWVRKG